MYVRFWGTRGSIATPGPQPSHYGGHTACVEVRSGDGTLITLGMGRNDKGMASTVGRKCRVAASPMPP